MALVSRDYKADRCRVIWTCMWDFPTLEEAQHLADRLISAGDSMQPYIADVTVVEPTLKRFRATVPYPAEYHHVPGIIATSCEVLAADADQARALAEMHWSPELQVQIAITEIPNEVASAPINMAGVG